MPTYTLDTSLARDVWATLDAFTKGYVTAAMWTLLDADGHSLDYLGLHDIAPETIEQAKRECAEFLTSNQTLLNETGRDDDEHHGHDFWLTRNRHGAGFWDRGYGSVGERLTAAAHAWGEAYWYLGDDGFVYQM